jgi:hypothetical protein
MSPHNRGDPVRAISDTDAGGALFIPNRSKWRRLNGAARLE